MSLHGSAVSTLTSWRPALASQESLRQAFLSFLAARPDACQRSCEPGHLTASALIIDADGENVLLALHPRVGRWIQLGGHCEPVDATLTEAALREATEESGLTTLSLHPEPIHLDVHPITCSLGLPTRHFDVRFVIQAAPGAQPICSEESHDLRWWPLERLPEGSEELQELVEAAMTTRQSALVR